MQTEMISSVISAVVTIVVTLILIQYFSRKFSGLEKISDVLESTFADEKNVEMLSQSLNSMQQIGVAAGSLNAILSDEETFDGLLTELASRIRKSFIGAMMGTASGDSRRKEKAERLVTEAMVQGAKQINPALGMILKVTGLDEELEKDPEMLSYIIQVVQEKGLMDMFSSQMQSIPQSQGLNTESVNKTVVDF